MSATHGSLIIGFDFSKGPDKSILIVGTKHEETSVDILNAFMGKEAIDLYEKLVTVKKPVEETEHDS